MVENTLETVLGYIGGTFVAFMLLCMFVRFGNDFVYSLFGVDLIGLLKEKLRKKAEATSREGQDPGSH